MATSNTLKKTKSTTYPEPLLVPSTLTHKHTFIILHGRGSNAQKFGPPLLSTEISPGTTLQTAFPHAKFVFPTASKRRAQIYNRSIIHQWFDNWSLSVPTEREALMLDGLRESSSYVHGLITEAVKEVGANNVALGGLSQGCAAMLISMLTWDGEPLAAAFGMCGWLPLRQHLADITDPQTQSDNGENPFAQEEDADGELDLPAQAVAWLREELDLPIRSTPSVIAPNSASSPTPSPSSPNILLPFQRTPLFLAHGTADEKVKIELGLEARDCLTSLQIDVTWSEYESLGHWYSGHMLGALVECLEHKTDWAAAVPETCDRENLNAAEEINMEGSSGGR
ncbi:MAG: hypothetical protein ASARMPREDX12_007246 [Alectoria sarmentosa]|nr:MAG: hypothetical protein ASARMPREDX12_007246 [Alectoria sarmentosa]